MPALDGPSLAGLFRETRAEGVKTVLDIVMPGPGDHWRQLEPLGEGAGRDQGFVTPIANEK
jgi:hypothetical protein